MYQSLSAQSSLASSNTICHSNPFHLLFRILVIKAGDDGNERNERLVVEAEELEGLVLEAEEVEAEDMEEDDGIAESDVITLASTVEVGDRLKLPGASNFEIFACNRCDRTFDSQHKRQLRSYFK